MRRDVLAFLLVPATWSCSASSGPEDALGGIPRSSPSLRTGERVYDIVVVEDGVSVALTTVLESGMDTLFLSPCGEGAGLFFRVERDVDNASTLVFEPFCPGVLEPSFVLPPYSRRVDTLTVRASRAVGLLPAWVGAHTGGGFRIILQTRSGLYGLPDSVLRSSAFSLRRASG